MIYVVAAIYGAGGVLALHRAFPRLPLAEFLYLVAGVAAFAVCAGLVVQ